MKELINFINEVHIKEDNSKSITEEDKKSYINYSYKYFEYLNNNGKLGKAIEETFKYINDNVLKIMNDNHISNFIDKKIIPRIIEYYLAAEMSDINGFEFKQSEENSKNKDICCKKINDKILEEDIFKDINDNPLEFFSIELKCSSKSSSSITGNKSYAIDKSDNQKKNKQSFYILITYDYFDNKTNENKNDENKNITIKLKNAYFGYIVQNDWIYGNSGNSSRLKIKDLFHSDDNEKNNRIIQII